MGSFSQALISELLSSKQNFHTDNFDPMMQYDARYKKVIPNASLKAKWIDYRIPLGGELPINRTFKDSLSPQKFYRSLAHSFEEMSFLYNALQNQSSKDLLIKLIAYKILGHERVKLPRNSPKYWDDISRLDSLVLDEGNLKISFVNLDLLLMDLKSLGFALKVNVTKAGAAAIFIQKQYEYAAGNVHIKAQPGDIVLDCGACWGETSLYFAHEVGQSGKVYSFEFIPENIQIFNHNLNHNSHFKEVIELIKHPVWNVSDETLFYSDHGPGSSVDTSVGLQSESQTCKTISIDDFVSRFDVPRVDFIKMDIEGAELKALEGARQTIGKYKPTLAISLYHKPDDFITIPKLIKALSSDYDFYLDHHTIHFWETVLYCVHKNKA